MSLLLLAAATIGIRDLNPSEKVKIASIVKSELKDPDSAKIEWQKARSGSWYCGRVNAKNSYGGYTGFSPFMVLKSSKAGPIQTIGPVILGEGEALISTIIKTCSEAGYNLEGN